MSKTRIRCKIWRTEQKIVRKVHFMSFSASFRTFPVIFEKVFFFGFTRIYPKFKVYMPIHDAFNIVGRIG